MHGKSSLLNLILNEERAIVTDVEGTTRDTIEEYIVLKGVPLKIIDTAGIREAKDDIEKIGIEKSIEIAKKSDIIVCIFDISKELNNEDRKILELAKNKNSIIVLNKIDLNKDLISNEVKKINKPIIKMSVKDREGIEELYSEIIKIFNLNDIANNGEIIISNNRHKFLIKNSLKNVELCRMTINSNMPIDVVSGNIREILGNLNEITGDQVTEDIIDEIFSKFCLGK